MTARRLRARWLGWVVGLLLVGAVLAGVLILTRSLWSAFLFDVTGEEFLPAQVRGGLEWLGNLVRPQPDTADFVPVANAGANPFGVNTFLEQEVEPQKRERAVEMIAAAGFHWIRQEFAWEDIEIHGKGDFEDRRHEPYRSAWDKYDHIVDLAGRYGLEIIARLSNPPAWSRAGGDAAGPFAPPDDLDDYGDFVEAVVRRYEGRIHHYQIWNEPNIYPEWGERAVSPEEYTELLKVGYTRVKDACPRCVVLSGALAQTIPLGPRDLNDFIFLQRMYDAGAGDYFDVLAMQGYGLWSGPTDRRMRARVLNFSRPLYLREIMVRNGDAAKPIWITEMNWNAPPPDLPDKSYGSVTAEQQARYAVLAFQRAQQEWPWVGVINVWFFKRATDTETDQAMYYFRLVEPDFTPLPVYHALKEAATGDQARVLYPGVHQEDHWALAYAGQWEVGPQPPTPTQMEAGLGPEHRQYLENPAQSTFAYRAGGLPDATLRFAFAGTDVWLDTAFPFAGKLGVTLDEGAEQEIVVPQGDPEDRRIALAQGLDPGRHTIQIRPVEGEIGVDSLTIRARAPLVPWLVAGAAVLGLGLVGVLVIGLAARRRRWFERSRAQR
jgi:hypothetical protein